MTIQGMAAMVDGQLGASVTFKTMAVLTLRALTRTNPFSVLAGIKVYILDRIFVCQEYTNKKPFIVNINTKNILLNYVQHFSALSATDLA